MLESGYLPNPLQQLGGQFSQALQSTGPWGSTVATPTDGNMPTGSLSDIAAAQTGNAANLPGAVSGQASANMSALGDPGPVLADLTKASGNPLSQIAQGATPISPGAVGMNSYSQLLSQQAGQLPALQQQQQSNRSALLQALNNLTQQQANFKPSSGVNLPLLAMAAGAASNPYNPLGPSLAAYGGAMAQQNEQERAQNNLVTQEQMKNAMLPEEFGEEDIKNSMDAAKEGLNAEKIQELLAMQQQKISPSLPMAAPGTTPIDNDVTKAFPGIDPSMAARAQAIIEGRDQLMPREADVQQMKEIINTVDPTYDFSNPGQRTKTANDYSPAGKSGQQVTALNVLMGHLNDLDQQVDKLGNVQVPLIGSTMNYLGNQAAAASGNPNITTADQTAKKASDELAALWKSNGATDAEIKRNLSDFDVYSNSPAQLKGAIQNAAGNLAFSKMQSLASNYQNSMGGKVPPMGILQPNNAAFLQKMGVDTSDIPLQPALTTAKPSLNSNPSSPTLPGPRADPNNPSSAPAAAIAHLQANPKLAPDFDAKYGAGSSARILGGQ